MNTKHWSFKAAVVGVIFVTIVGVGGFVYDKLKDSK